MTSTSERQAAGMRQRYADEHPADRDWITDPQTGAERQAAALLAPPDADDELAADKRCATERQAAGMLDGRQLEAT